MSRSVPGSLAGLLAVFGFVLGLVAVQVNTPGTSAPMAFADDMSSAFSSAENSSELPASSAYSSVPLSSAGYSSEPFSSSASSCAEGDENCAAPAALTCNCGCSVGGTGATSVSLCTNPTPPPGRLLCDSNYVFTNGPNGQPVSTTTDCRGYNGVQCSGYTSTGALRLGRLHSCFGPIAQGTGGSSSSNN